MSKHSQTLFDNNKQHQTTSDTATHDGINSRGTVEQDRQRHTMKDERRTVDDNGDTVRNKRTQRSTEQQSTAPWSKISTGLENGLLLKNAAQIFRATDENWASHTRRAAHTAHSKQSKRSYALFLRYANSNTAAQCYEQRVGLFTASVFALISVICVSLFDYGQAANSGKYI